MTYRGQALTIAGSDSGGGAGIQADLKTFAALKVFGTSVITAITAQNSRGVDAIQNAELSLVSDQLDAVLSDFEIGGAKTGMVSKKETIEIIAQKISHYEVSNLVVDPVMIAQSGDPLLEDNARQALEKELIPLALLVTPNRPEAEKISGLAIRDLSSAKKAAEKIARLGPAAVLIKGGHFPGEKVVDLLFYQGEFTEFEFPRIKTENTHGTGCTLSAAIAAELAAGEELYTAVERGRKYLQQALETSFQPGKGYGTLGLPQVAWL